MKKVLALILVVIFLVGLSTSLLAVSSEQVIKNLHQAYEKQWSKVNDLTMVYSGMGGSSSTMYYKRANIGGKTVYKNRMEAGQMVTVYDGVYQWSPDPLTGNIKKEKLEFDPQQQWKNLTADNVQYGGTDSVEGKKAHVLIVKDMTKIIKTMQRPGQPEAKAKGKIWLDAQNWVFLKMEIISEGGSGGGPGMTTAMVMEMKDYRKTDGMLIPFKTVTKMPYGGSVTSTVKEVKVNSGLSDDLFDGTKLKPGKPMFRMPKQ